LSHGCSKEKNIAIPGWHAPAHQALPTEAMRVWQLRRVEASAYVCSHCGHYDGREVVAAGKTLKGAVRA